MIVLTLPLPDSPNKRQSHHMAAHRAKNEYRELCWARAIKQAMPKAAEDLPSKVRVSATLFVRGKRDEDNANFAYKNVLDALKQKQTGSVRWRQGAYDDKGYLIDDDPDHCEVTPVEQVIDRKNTRMELRIEAA